MIQRIKESLKNLIALLHHWCGFYLTGDHHHQFVGETKSKVMVAAFEKHS